MNSKYFSNPLTAEERKALLEELFVFGKSNQYPFYMRMLLLLFISTVIASAGLLADSAAVVIGAMLVAPMMRPVISSAAAITLNWHNRLYQSLILTAIMAVLAVLIAAAFAILGPEMLILPHEIIKRTQPTFFDLAISLAAGMGGAYTITRKESSALPGVAMAVSLLPPLASSGILIVQLEYHLALKAFILFATNFVAMIVAASLMFRILGIQPKGSDLKRRLIGRLYFTIFLVLVGFICIPLYFFSQEVWYNAMYKAQKSAQMHEWLEANEAVVLDAKFDNKNKMLHLTIQSPNPPLNIQGLYEEVTKARKTLIGHDDPFKIKLIWTQGMHIDWPPDSDKLAQVDLSKDYQPALKSYQWDWSGSQYAEGHWLKPEPTVSYKIGFGSDNIIYFYLPCGDFQGTYDLNEELITIHAITPQTCIQSKVAHRFLGDINFVSRMIVNDNFLVLQIQNSRGIIYFKGVKP